MGGPRLSRLLPAPAPAQETDWGLETGDVSSACCCGTENRQRELWPGRGQGVVVASTSGRSLRNFAAPTRTSEMSVNREHRRNTRKASDSVHHYQQA